jgi:hypothetical protein
MSKSALGLLGIAFVCLITSLLAHTHEIVDGLGKALFGVFMILFFIVQFFGHEENA